MSTFNEELESGFAELAAEVGEAVPVLFKGTPIPYVLSNGADDAMRADTKLGTVRTSRIMISRSALALLETQPAAGDYFDAGSGAGAYRLRIENVEDDDPTDTTIVFQVKKRG